VLFLLALPLVANDGLEDESVAPVGQPLPYPGVELEVRYAEQVEDLEEVMFLLVEREETAERPEVRVVLDADRHRVANLVYGLQARLERRSGAVIGARERCVEDGIDREEPVRVFVGEDRTQLVAPAVAVVALRQVGELDVDAEAEVRCPARRRDELGAQLDARVVEAGVAAQGRLEVAAELPPRQEAYRGLDGEVVLVVGRVLGARGGRAAVGDGVQVQFEPQDARCVGRAVVGLDLEGVDRARRRREEGRGDAETEAGEPASGRGGA
jgi:hypothetical protein